MDVTGYRQFIESCPTIEDHVVIMDSATANAFNYHMNPGRHRTPLSVDKPSAAKEKSDKDEESDVTDDEDIDSPDPSLVDKEFDMDTTTVTAIASFVSTTI